MRQRPRTFERQLQSAILETYETVTHAKIGGITGQFGKCRATLLHPIERTYRWQQLAIEHREKVRSAEWWVSEHDSEQTFAGEQQSCGISIAITRT